MRRSKIHRRIRTLIVVFHLSVGIILIARAHSKVDWMIDIQQPAVDIEVSHDGSWMVVAVPSGIEIRSTQNGAMIASLDLSSAPRALAISHKDEIAWIAYNPFRNLGPMVGGVISYQPGENPSFTHTPLISETIVPQFTVEFAGNVVLTGSESCALQVWSAATGRHMRTVEEDDVSANGGIAYNHKEGFVVFGGGSRGSALSAGVWTPSDSQLQIPIQTSNSYGLGSVAISPSGSLVMTGADRFRLEDRLGEMEAWSLPNGTLRYRLPVQSEEFRFSRDGHRLATLSFIHPLDNPTVRLDFWNASEGRLISSVKSLDILGLHFESLAFSADGRHLFLIGTRRIGPDERIGRLVALTTPVVVNPVQLKNRWATITWSGGLGPYEVELRTSLQEPWIHLGETTESVWVKRIPGPAAFYRVRSLAP